MAIMTRFSGRKTLQFQIPDSSRQEDSDSIWPGKTWICNKQLKLYSDSVPNGTKIPVHSFVWVLSKKKRDYLGYLEDMYEDPNGEKMVKVLCDNFLPQILSFKIFMCHREYKNNEVKTFSLSTLRGYVAQSLRCTIMHQQEVLKANTGKDDTEIAKAMVFLVHHHG